MSGTPTTDHAHVLCDEAHQSGPFADGRPHCAECGAIAVVLGTIEVIEVGLSQEGECLLGLHPEGACPLCRAEDPKDEAVGIVVRLANALGGLTVAELEELYGDPLAEIMADAQAWSTKG